MWRSLTRGEETEPRNKKLTELVNGNKKDDEAVAEESTLKLKAPAEIMKLQWELMELIGCHPATVRILELKWQSEHALWPYLEIGRKLQPTAQKKTITWYFQSKSLGLVSANSTQSMEKANWYILWAVRCDRHMWERATRCTLFLSSLFHLI